MKFEKILVVESKKDTDKHREASGKLRNFLNKSPIDLDWVYHHDLMKYEVDASDLVITLGGDGTFIETANLTENSYILGINSHPETSEGALTSLSTDSFGDLEEILNGKFNVIERPRAEIKLNGNLLKEYATNEVYMGVAWQFHTSRYVVNFKEKEEEQRSSGILVATGTGSGAWFSSAGGKEFNYDEKKLSFIVREPYIGRRVYTPKILGGDILPGEKITITNRRDSGGILAIGFKTYDLKKNDVVEVSLSKNPLKVVNTR